jgi:hypothetical protein
MDEENRCLSGYAGEAAGLQGCDLFGTVHTLNPVYLLFRHQVTAFFLFKGVNT